MKKPLSPFILILKKKKVLDIGASTGGFTDCAIQHGADFVYSCDVGYNQLAWSLRNHEKVEVMERMNFRYAVKEDFKKGTPDIAVADVSFISLKWIVPPLYSILGENGEAMLLVKPQFEAGRTKVGKKGIVRDPAVHLEVLENTTSMAAAAALPAGMSAILLLQEEKEILNFFFIFKREVIRKMNCQKMHYLK